MEAGMQQSARRPPGRPGRFPVPSDHPLRIWRRASRRSLEAVAAEIGWSASTISRVERGLQKPAPQLVRRIIEVAGGALDLAAFE
jgi:hypothetical protein